MLDFISMLIAAVAVAWILGVLIGILYLKRVCDRKYLNRDDDIASMRLPYPPTVDERKMFKGCSDERLFAQLIWRGWKIKATRLQKIDL